MQHSIQAIASLEDPRVALYRNLTDAALLRDHGVFVAEGRLVVRRLLAQRRFEARSVLVTPAALRAMHDIIRDAEVPVYVADRQLLNAIAGFNIHRGCLAIARRPEDRGIGALPENATRALVLEDVGDADNVGAAFRNAAAFGADAVLITSGSCDPLYRKAVRVSMGAVLQVPFGTITDLAAAVIELKRRSFTVIALTPGPDAVDIRTLRPNTVARAVLMLGSEGEGLSKVALAAADVRVRIPISTAVDSLNVATAAAIGLWVLGSLGP